MKAMAVYYLMEDELVADEESVLLGKFDDCEYYQQASKYVIKLPPVVQEYFDELLTCRFPMYGGGTGRRMYLVWDYIPYDFGVKSVDPEKNSFRFFKILRHLWKIRASQRSVFMLLLKRRPTTGG
jgi:hypothetical protein